MHIGGPRVRTTAVCLFFLEHKAECLSRVIMSDSPPGASATRVAELFLPNSVANSARAHIKKGDVLRRRVCGASPALRLATVSDGVDDRRLRLQIGARRERAGIDAYAASAGVDVTSRNTMQLSTEISHPSNEWTLVVTGRPDGMCDGRVIIEHKRRVRGLLHYVPLHERVQCHLYMRMLGLRTSRLVETFGASQAVHSVPFDDKLWNRIVERIGQSDLYRRKHPT